jgi:hypothetical protein
MKISDIFSRDPERKIKSVILAQDESTIETEVDEFVLTNDTARQLSEFLEEFIDGNDPQAIGAWFSGFFGSGKSHLLKIVSHLVGDVDSSGISREKVIEAFESKAQETSQGVFLKGQLTRLRAMKAKVVLFNISSQFKAIAGDETATALRVFYQVWNESLGLSKVVGVAKFESTLRETGNLDAFVTEYNNITGVPWAKSRDGWLVYLPKIQEALKRATGSEVSIETLEAQLGEATFPSPLEFAQQVGAWLNANPEYQRVVFMVDEVGQFIGTNSKIMLDLQSVVEAAFTLDKRMWVGVTSQEDLDSTLGKLKGSGHDFQKISQRFKLKFQLTSASVKEVVNRRLLDKRDEVEPELVAMFKESESRLLTALSFKDEAKNHLIPYRDQADFVATYPLVGWHLSVLTDAMKEISNRSGFTGQFLDIGARSTLGIFQEVVRSIAGNELGQLVSMDSMYDAISDMIKVPYKQSVDEVDSGPSSLLEKRLIRVLLLVKHVTSFKPTPDNLAALLLSSIHESKAQLVSDVEVALKSLTDGLYVEKRGNEYSYLTSIEKDIEQEIAGKPVDAHEIDQKFFDLVFASHPKSFFKHEASGRDFKFNFKLDDVAKGQANNELSLNVVRLAQAEQSAIARSAGQNALYVLLEVPAEVEQEIIHLVKSEKYLNQNTGSADEEVNQVIESKMKMLGIFKKDLVSRIEALLGSATLAANGGRLEVPTSTDLQKRLSQAWQLVVNQVYYQMSVATNKIFTREDLQKVLVGSEEVMVDDLPPASEEILNWLSLAGGNNAAIDFKALVEHFERAPFGWSLASINFFVAHLVVRSRVSVRRDGRLLSNSEILRDITNTSLAQVLVLSIATKVDSSLIDRVRNVCIKDFGAGNPPREPIALGAEVRNQITSLRDKAQDYLNLGYAFAGHLGTLVNDANLMLGYSDEALLLQHVASLESLGSNKAEQFNPIESFMNSQAQKEIFLNALDLIKTSKPDVLNYAGQDGVRLIELVADPNLIEDNRIPELKRVSESSISQLAVETERLKENSLQAISDFESGVRESELFLKATEASQELFSSTLGGVRGSVRGCSRPSEVLAASSRFEATVKQDSLKCLVTTEQEASAGEVGRKIVNLQSLLPAISGGAFIESSEDVDAYVSQLRATLLEAIKTQRIVK